MGLEVGFILKLNSSELDLGYFGRCGAIARWMRQTGRSIDEDQTRFVFTHDQFRALLEVVQPFALMFGGFTDQALDGMQELIERGEEEKVRACITGFETYSQSDFNPFNEGIGIFSVVSLYRMLKMILENEWEKYTIGYISE